MPGAKDGLTLTISGQYKDNKQSKIFFADTMRTREYGTILPNKVKNITIPPGHYTAQINLLTKLNAGPIEEGQALTVPTQFATYSRTFGVKEWGTLAFRSDIVQRRIETHSVSDELSRRMGDAMSRREEEEIIQIFDTIGTKLDLSGNHYDSTGVVLSSKANASRRPVGINPVTFAMAAMEMERDRVSELGPKPLGSMPFGVISPNAAFMLGYNIMSSTAPSTTAGIGGPTDGGGGNLFKVGEVAIPEGMSAALIRDFAVGNAQGVDIYKTPNIRVFDNVAGTAVASFNDRSGKKLGSATATAQYNTVSDGNAASHGAVLIPETIYNVMESAYRTAQERDEKLRGEWYIATHWYQPHLVHDAWGVFLYTHAPTLSKNLPSNYDFVVPKGWS